MRYELRSNTTPVGCYNGGNLPTGKPVAYGGKPAYSAGFTATHWLLYNT
ncbi:hypothetical protein [Nostoc sp.]